MLSIQTEKVRVIDICQKKKRKNVFWHVQNHSCKNDSERSHSYMNDCERDKIDFLLNAILYQ